MKISYPIISDRTWSPTYNILLKIVLECGLAVLFQCVDINGGSSGFGFRLRDYGFWDARDMQLL